MHREWASFILYEKNLIFEPPVVGLLIVSVDTLAYFSIWTFVRSEGFWAKLLWVCAQNMNLQVVVGSLRVSRHKNSCLWIDLPQSKAKGLSTHKQPFLCWDARTDPTTRSGYPEWKRCSIYCNISFKYCDILQYIAQVSRIRKTRHILLKQIKK